MNDTPIEVADVVTSVRAHWQGLDLAVYLLSQKGQSARGLVTDGRAEGRDTSLGLDGSHTVFVNRPAVVWVLNPQDLSTTRTHWLFWTKKSSDRDVTRTGQPFPSSAPQPPAGQWELQQAHLSWSL